MTGLDQLVESVELILVVLVIVIVINWLGEL